MTRRRRRITRASSPPVTDGDKPTKAATLPPYQRVLTFMASFSSVAGDARATQGYVLELCSEICASIAPER